MNHHSSSVSLALAHWNHGCYLPLLILQPQSHPEYSIPQKKAMSEIPIDHCLKQECFRSQGKLHACSFEDGWRFF